MNKIFTYIFCLFTLSLIGQNSASGSRYLLTFDPLLQYPLVNIQENFQGERIPIRRDWIQGYGVELLKYFPNEKRFYTFQLKYAGRHAILKTTPALFLKEDLLMISSSINHSFSKKKPLFLDIDRFFIGAGMAYTFIPNGSLFYYSSGFIDRNIAIFNKNRLEGLVHFGFIEDVFNISPRTSLSKFNISFKFPLLRSANTFSRDYIELPNEILFLQKSNSFRVPIEIQYIHMFDFNKNKSGLDYAIKWIENPLNRTKESWNAMLDPWKSYLPPFVNNAPPRKKFFGNFYFDFTLHRFQDSLYIPKNDILIGLNKRFTSFAFGYSFNFLGNFNKDYSIETPGIEIYSPVQKWRYNFFLGLGYKTQVLRGYNDMKNYDMYLPFLQGKGGIKLLNGNKKLSLAIGIGYQYLTAPETYLGHIRTETPDLPTTNLFFGLGYKNNFIKLEYESIDFKFIKHNNSYNLLYSIGI